MKANRINSIVTATTEFLTIFGAVNWGLTGLFRLNLIRKLFGKSPATERAAYCAVGLSGLWMGAQIAIQTVLTARSFKEAPAPAASLRHPILLQRLPQMEGGTLSGRRIRLPDDVKGKVTLLALGFSYESRWDVEKWTDIFRERFNGRDDVVFYEIPVISGLARLVGPMIDAGMRQGTPPHDYDRVLTIYGQAGRIREALGASDGTDTVVILLDRNGMVLFEAAGSPDETKLHRLVSIMVSLLGLEPLPQRRAAS